MLEIPEMLMDILEHNAYEKAMGIGFTKEGFTFKNKDNIKIRVQEINTKINQSPWLIPYPLDPTFYIYSL